MTALRRAASAATRYVDEVLAIAGLGLVAYGLGQVHPALGPIALGVGLLLAVRFGSD